MTKHRPSPSKAEGREQQFEKLLATIGIGESADPLTRYALTQNLKEIELSYARLVAASGKQPDRKLVRRYRAAITKALMLSTSIGCDFLGNEIGKAGWSRHNPDADDRTLQMLMDDHGHERMDVVAVLTGHGLDIDHWIKVSGDVYRKRDVRKLVVEPFLQLMAQHEITTSRRQLPRKRMFDALFDWLGIEQKFRLSSPAINAIARDLASDNSSDPNGKQRTKN